MKVGDRVITIRNPPCVAEVGLFGEVTYMGTYCCVIHTKKGSMCVDLKDIELVTFKTYLCLLNKDQPLKNLIKGITQTLLGK